MKRVMYKTFFLVLVTFSMAAIDGAVYAQVYKTVDEDGNITYTDIPPKGGAEQVKLAPISVIEAPAYEQAEEVVDPVAEDAGSNDLSVKELRRNYRDFAIVAPLPEESLWHPEAPISIAWNTRYELQLGMQVLIYIDGTLQTKTSVQLTSVPKLDRGEHKVEAKLVDENNRTIATAEPVTFFIKRPNVYSNRARRGG